VEVRSKHLETETKFMKQAYEGYGLRRNGEVFTVEVMECEKEEEALQIARHYADLWRSPVRLYRTPGLNTSSVSSFNLWPDQMVFVGEVIPSE